VPLVACTPRLGIWHTPLSGRAWGLGSPGESVTIKKDEKARWAHQLLGCGILYPSGLDPDFPKRWFQGNSTRSWSFPDSPLREFGGRQVLSRNFRQALGVQTRLLVQRSVTIHIRPAGAGPWGACKTQDVATGLPEASQALDLD
jgi:hypothetical protein